MILWNVLERQPSSQVLLSSLLTCIVTPRLQLPRLILALRHRERYLNFDTLLSERCQLFWWLVALATSELTRCCSCFWEATRWRSSIIWTILLMLPSKESNTSPPIVGPTSPFTRSSSCCRNLPFYSHTFVFFFWVLRFWWCWDVGWCKILIFVVFQCGVGLNLACVICDFLQ